MSTTPAPGQKAIFRDALKRAVIKTLQKELNAENAAYQTVIQLKTFLIAQYGEGMSKTTKSVGSKTEFCRLVGIGPELIEVITELVENPENFYSISSEKRHEIERQMDAILASFMQ